MAFSTTYVSVGVFDVDQISLVDLVHQIRNVARKHSAIKNSFVQRYGLQLA